MSATSAKTPAPDRRPYQRASDGTGERVVYRMPPGGPVSREVLRQVGWHGFTGAFYSLAEGPSRHGPGGFAPLWETVDVETATLPELWVAYLAENGPPAHSCTAFTSREAADDYVADMAGRYGLPAEAWVVVGYRLNDAR